MDDFNVDTSVMFNDDGTINIEFKNVAIEDVDYLFASLGTEATQLSFIAGLEAAVAARDGN